MDQLSNQWKAIKELSEFSNSSKGFEIENMPFKTWSIVDPVHLLKNVRNNLMRYDINVCICLILIFFSLVLIISLKITKLQLLTI